MNSELLDAICDDIRIALEKVPISDQSLIGFTNLRETFHLLFHLFVEVSAWHHREEAPQKEYSRIHRKTDPLLWGEYTRRNEVTQNCEYEGE